MPLRVLYAFLIGAACFASMSSRAEEITVVEFYNTTLKHYVLITDPAEVDAIASGAAGPGWERTGGAIDAFSAAGDDVGLVAVCRFYGNVAAGGPNSHFYTADPAECAAVKNDAGWRYEGVAFYIKLPTNRSCAAPDKPVYRAYNNGFHPPPGVNDGNHRFSLAADAIAQLASQGWTDEGIVFCAKGGTTPVASAGLCMLPPAVGFQATFHNSAGQTQQFRISGTPTIPVEVVEMQVGLVRVNSVTRLEITQANGVTFLDRGSTQTEVTGLGTHIVEDIYTGGVIPISLFSPGTSAGVSGAASGNITISGPVSCTSAVTGSFSWKYIFLGRERVTVPAGTFDACRFYYVRTNSLKMECDGGFGAGTATDELRMWFVEGMGLIRSQSLKEGVINEMTSFSP